MKVEDESTSETKSTELSGGQQTQQQQGDAQNLHEDVAQGVEVVLRQCCDQCVRQQFPPTWRLGPGRRLLPTVAAGGRTGVHSR